MPTPEPVTGEATERSETTATLNGTVDPEGNPLTECAFQHTTDAALKANDADEVQTLDLSATTGGGFNLSFEGKATGATGKSPRAKNSFETWSRSNRETSFPASWSKAKGSSRARGSSRSKARC